MLHLALHGLAVKIGQRDALGGQHGHVAVAKEEQVARVVQDGRNVAGDKVLILAQADDRRRAVARRDDLVRRVAADDGQSEDALQHLHRLAHGLFQRKLLVLVLQNVELFDQVRDDLGIGLGLVGMALFAQHLLQLEVILHNAVVHHNDGAAAIAVGMRVLFAGAAVRGPARVADAVGAVNRMLADDLFEVAQLAFGAAQLQSLGTAGHGDARRIVSAILQAAKAVNDDRDYLLLTNVSDDSTHGRLLGRTQTSLQ